MAYTPKEWVCGETITAEGLNNIEEGIQDALECCEDKGFECSEEITVLTEETVATTSFGAPFSMGAFAYPTLINAEKIRATLDGETYWADRTYSESPECYNYELGTIATIQSFTSQQPTNMITIWGSDTAGDHSIKIEIVEDDIVITECFEKAVKKVAPPLKYVKDYSSNNGGVIENSVGTNVASGDYSHAEGSGSTASGRSSHAEGESTTASGVASHAEGSGSTASGDYSHAESNAVASGDASHAQNDSTIAQGKAQTAIGRYNVPQGTADYQYPTDYAFIIGNGNATDGVETRSNALAIKWDGTFVFANGTEITPAQFASLLALL